LKKCQKQFLFKIATFNKPLEYLGTVITFLPSFMYSETQL
jgi:hypothetical protein